MFIAGMSIKHYCKSLPVFQSAKLGSVIFDRRTRHKASFICQPNYIE